MSLKHILYELINFIYPHVCVVCKTKLLYEEKAGVCLHCYYKLPKSNNYKEIDNHSEQILAGRFPFERAVSYSYYIKDGILETLIHELKYNNNPRIGLFLGSVFGADLIESDFIKTIDAIVPVPLHPQKMRQRGYNQAEQFAKGLSKSTSIPIIANNLVRVINNPTQTKRSKTQRWENVQGVFKLNDPMLLYNKHVLLVDDIITTGATLEACARALLFSEKIKISIATIGESL